MIIGKTYKEQDAEEQAKLKKFKETPPTWFAWCPVKIKSGEWVWLERVEIIYAIWDSPYTTNRLLSDYEIREYRRIV
jgi:hypothetical protein